jgi:antitoxin YefM
LYRISLNEISPISEKVRKFVPKQILMQVLNYTDFRKNLKSVLDKTVADHDVTIISRSKENDVVILSLADYNSWMETMYLLRSERNRARLLESVERIEKGQFESHDLIED